MVDTELPLDRALVDSAAGSCIEVVDVDPEVLECSDWVVSGSHVLETKLVVTSANHGSTCEVGGATHVGVNHDVSREVL